MTDPAAAAGAPRLARRVGPRSRVLLGPAFVFAGTAASLAALLRFADFTTVASVHGQTVVSSIERALAGVLGALADVGAVTCAGVVCGTEVAGPIVALCQAGVLASARR